MHARGPFTTIEYGPPGPFSTVINGPRVRLHGDLFTILHGRFNMLDPAAIRVHAPALCISCYFIRIMIVDFDI